MMLLFNMALFGLNSMLFFHLLNMFSLVHLFLKQTQESLGPCLILFHRRSFSKSKSIHELGSFLHSEY